MTKTVVFLGPTLPADEAKSILPEADYRPPAQAGDVYRAVAHDNARVVGLIDGVFGTVPSVWHKEILFAIGRGCAVLGSSSMGALRAAECAEFGMRGVGRIAELFTSGGLEDDDEVAVAHLDAESGFAVLSVPMVNLRLVAPLAVERGIVSAPTVEVFLRQAKAIYYPERTWDRLTEVARRLHLGQDLNEFLTFAQLPENDAKAQDARQLLSVLKNIELPSPQRSASNGDVLPEDTVFWRRLRQEADFPCTTPWFEELSGGVSIRTRNNVVRDALLDPADPGLGVDARLGVHLVRMLAEMLGLTPTRADVQERSEMVRREHGLLDAGQTRAWLAERRLSVREWQQAIEFALTTEMLETEFAGDLRAHVPLLVAINGGWSRYVDHRVQVEHEYTGAGEEHAALEAFRATPHLPSAPTMESLAARLGFTSMSEFITTVTKGVLPE